MPPEKTLSPNTAADVRAHLHTVATTAERLTAHAEAAIGVAAREGGPDRDILGRLLGYLEEGTAIIRGELDALNDVFNDAREWKPSKDPAAGF